MPKCQSCHKEFEPKWPNQKGCSKRCRRKIHKYVKKEYFGKSHCQRVSCIMCGRFFIQNVPGQIYCSKLCRDRNKYLKDLENARQKVRNLPAYIEENHRQKMRRSEVKQKCVFCGRTTGLIVHHRDRNPENNDLKNLVYLCGSDHQILHCFVLPVNNSLNRE